MEFIGYWRPGADKLIKLWNAYTGDILKTLSGHTEGVNDIAWAYDSERLASASDDKTVRLWDADTVRVPHYCTIMYDLCERRARMLWF